MLFTSIYMKRSNPLLAFAASLAFMFVITPVVSYSVDVALDAMSTDVSIHQQTAQVN